MEVWMGVFRQIFSETYPFLALSCVREMEGDGIFYAVSPENSGRSKANPGIPRPRVCTGIRPKIYMYEIKRYVYFGTKNLA